jgi:hypothetical protein
MPDYAPGRGDGIRGALPLLPLALLLAGCPSFSTMGTARTIPVGKTQFVVSPQAAYTKRWSIGGLDQRTDALFPQFELGIRHGVTEDVEVGAKGWVLGFLVDAKLQLLRSQSDSSGVDLAIAPGVGYLGFTQGQSLASPSLTASQNSLSFYLPLLVGINFAGGSQLVIGPKLIDQIILPSSQTGAGNVLWGGASLGYAWKVGDFRLLPEVTVVYPMSVVQKPGATFNFSGIAAQAGIGLLFGG